MNISELQNQNSENNKLISLKSYAAQKNDTNFSYYVEVSKTQEIKEQLQEKQEENNKQEEFSIQENQQLEETNKLTYTQSVENLKAGLFDLGITDEKTLNNQKDLLNYNIKFSELSLDDIKLFDSLSQKPTDLIVNSIDTQKGNFNITINNEGMNVSYRSLEVSKTLFNAIENASKTGKPIRLDFGQDTSVILKISKDGKLSADFIPNEKAMETILKNALPELKAKFDEENLPYSQLTYRHFNQQKNNQKGNNKEKKDE